MSARQPEPGVRAVEGVRMRCPHCKGSGLAVLRGGLCWLCDGIGWVDMHASDTERPEAGR